MCESALSLPKLPIFGKAAHVWENFPYVGSLPMRRRRLSIYGKPFDIGVHPEIEVCAEIGVHTDIGVYPDVGIFQDIGVYPDIGVHPDIRIYPDIWVYPNI